MTTFLFVHGINVRGKDLQRTLSIIQGQLALSLPGSSLQACAWGDDLGARLRCAGTSIPNYSSARGIGYALPEMEDFARWQFLYDDPFFELRLMAGVEPAEDRMGGPNQFRVRQELMNRLEHLSEEPTILQAMENVSWLPYFQTAVTVTFEAEELQSALDAQSASMAAMRGTIARAVFASTAREAEADGMPALQASQRDHLLRAIQEALGGNPMGVMAWLAAPLLGFSKRLMTRYLQRSRGALSDLASPVIGDVILYQGRGEPIRQRIAQAISACAAPVCIIGHSLGGVAVVDTLLLQPELVSKVKHLFTVGSQSGYFYENGALVGLAEPKPLPDHFPRWTNFYDCSDVLSYLTVPLLGSRADDRELSSGQPFPQSHSAYWTNVSMWSAIAALAAE